MNRFAERKVEAALQKAGRVLPANVVKQSENMVAVALKLRDIPYVLPQVTTPLSGPQCIRCLMQPDDKGIVIPVDTYPGGVSRQGGGVTDLTPPANPSALMFLPIGNTEWEGVNGQAVIIYGPGGVTIRDADSSTTFSLTPDSITITTPMQLRVTIESTVFTLTNDTQNLTGQARKLKSGTASTSPAIMYEGWKSLVSQCNSHVHSNGDGGNSTGNATVQFNGSITE